jgi:hypothetical protein
MTAVSFHRLRSQHNAEKRLLAMLAGVIVFAVAIGSAASLGGLGGTELGADLEAVGSCDSSGVDVAYVTGHSAAGFVVTDVTLSSIDAACDTQSVKVELHDSSDLTVGTGSSTADASGSVTVNIAEDPLAESVEGIAVVISG